VVHAYNPSYSGGRDQEDCGSKPSRMNSSMRPYLEENLSWQSTGGLAQGESPKFKPQYHTHTHTHTHTHKVLFETVSCYVAQAMLELEILLVHPSEWRSSLKKTVWNISLEQKAISERPMGNGLPSVEYVSGKWAHSTLLHQKARDGDNEHAEAWVDYSTLSLLLLTGFSYGKSIWRLVCGFWHMSHFSMYVALNFHCHDWV
jgi:hypothetical protein